MVNNSHLVDIPKTYTVSYFDEVEWNKDLTPQEIAQQQELADLQNQLGENDKAIGPCYRGCGYANRDCEHYFGYLGKDYIPLHLACPGAGCVGGDAYL
jgi:hypothetical protein